MRKKLKIVFLDFDDFKNPLLNAGQAKATFEVATRLAKKGHRIISICSKYPGFKDRTDKGITYKHIGIGSDNIRLNNLFYILFLPFTVIRLKADIIIECFTAPISTLFSPVFTKIPVVALATSFEADRFSKLYHLPFNLIERLGLRFYKYFLPYTKFFDQKMKQVNPKIISKIVPEGVGKEFFKIKRQKPEFILFLGRFDMGQKGIDLLLKAYAKICEQIPWPLWIVGKGPDKNKIINLINDLEIAHKVKVCGPAYGLKKHKLLSRALYIAFPSRHEGFSLFALEALAAGLTLAAFDIPGLSWTNRKIVCKAKPFNLSSYSKIMLKLTNLKFSRDMGKRARKFVRKFTWESVSKEFESFFYQILESKS